MKKNSHTQFDWKYSEYDERIDKVSNDNWEEAITIFRNIQSFMFFSYCCVPNGINGSFRSVFVLPSWRFSFVHSLHFRHEMNFYMSVFYFPYLHLVSFHLWTLCLLEFILSLISYFLLLIYFHFLYSYFIFIFLEVVFLF